MVVLPRDGKAANVPTTGSSKARIVAVHPNLCAGALQEYSSTKVRKALREGNIDKVATYLPQQVSGHSTIMR